MNKPLPFAVTNIQNGWTVFFAAETDARSHIDRETKKFHAPLVLSRVIGQFEREPGPLVETAP